MYVLGLLPEPTGLKMPLLVSPLHSKGAQKHNSLRDHSTQLIPSSSSETAHAFVDFYCLYRDAKAMYSCEAEHSHELSFPQGAHFTNGKQRKFKVTVE